MPIFIVFVHCKPQNPEEKHDINYPKDANIICYSRARWLPLLPSHPPFAPKELVIVSQSYYIIIIALGFIIMTSPVIYLWRYRQNRVISSEKLVAMSN